MRSCRTTIATILLAATILAPALTDQAAAQGGSGGSSPYQCQPICGGDTTVWPWQYPPIAFSAQIQDNKCPFGTCCTVTAWYRYRRVCDVPSDQFQIEITTLQWDRDCSPTGFDPVPMLLAIVNGLLALNPMNFPPLAGDAIGPQCMSNYTVQAASCWRNELGTNAARNCAVNPNDYACCKGAYQICRTDGPNGPYRKILWLGQTTVLNNCAEPCKPSCGAFDDDGIINRRKNGPSGISEANPSGTTSGMGDATASAVLVPPEQQQR